MNFSTVKTITIPEGNVTKISHDGSVLWQKPKSFTNLADPTSADWLVGYRLNSSGVPVVAEDTTVTNFIACKKGDILRVNMDLRSQGQRITGFDVDTGKNVFVGYFTNSYSNVVSDSSIKDKITYENGISSYELMIGGSGNTLYGADNMTVRFSFITSAIAAEDIIITINEEIS